MMKLFRLLILLCVFLISVPRLFGQDLSLKVGEPLKNGLVSIEQKSNSSYLELLFSFEGSPLLEILEDREGDVLIILAKATDNRVGKEIFDISSAPIKRIKLFPEPEKKRLKIAIYLNYIPLYAFSRIGDKALLTIFRSAKTETVTEIRPGLILREESDYTRDGSRTIYQIEIAPAPDVKGDTDPKINQQKRPQLKIVRSGKQDDGTARRYIPNLVMEADGLVAVNGGFFSKEGVSLSQVISEGRLLSTGAYPTRPMLLQLTSGRFLISRFRIEPFVEISDELPDKEKEFEIQSNIKDDEGEDKSSDLDIKTTTLQPQESSEDEPPVEKPERKRNERRVIPITAVNQLPKKGEITLLTKDFPYQKIDGAFSAYLFRDGLLREKTKTPLPCPTLQDEFTVVTDIDPAADPFNSLSIGQGSRFKFKVKDEAGGELEVTSAIGGGPYLVRNGKVEVSTAKDSIKPDISNGKNARTAVALLKDGTLLFVVVKETQDKHFSGMSLEELADYLLKLGAVEAINLDGGGSTQLAIRGDLINIPDSLQRKLSDAIILF